jgi:glycosyltransferase involved in cell wall biosynthesis
LNKKVEDSLVSIIVPNKNHGFLLQECLYSIKKQSYKEIEIIVVDGNSNDSSDDVISNFSNIRVIKGKDRNSSHACSIGLDECFGKYVMFLTSTDYLVDTDFIRNAVNELEENSQISLIYGNYCISNFRENPKIVYFSLFKKHFNSHEKLFKHWLVTKETFQDHSYLILKTVAKECTSSPEKYSQNFEQIPQDFLLELKFNFMSKGYKSKYRNFIVFMFRKHLDQISQIHSTSIIFASHQKRYIEDCNNFYLSTLISKYMIFKNSAGQESSKIFIKDLNFFISRYFFYVTSRLRYVYHLLIIRPGINNKFLSYIRKLERRNRKSSK